MSKVPGSCAREDCNDLRADWSHLCPNHEREYRRNRYHQKREARALKDEQEARTKAPHLGKDFVPRPRDEFGLVIKDSSPMSLYVPMSDDVIPPGAQRRGTQEEPPTADDLPGAKLDWSAHDTWTPDEWAAFNAYCEAKEAELTERYGPPD